MMPMPTFRRKLKPAQSDAVMEIVNRLLRSLPSARFELDTFLRLAGVVVTREIQTAAVECSHYPRLLINPDFVQKYCQRDEHLFLLVMHEMWHILLAHTSLYPQMTEAHNIAFDAIINAELLQQFKDPEYLGFFERINPPDKFPHLLLRPPIGWPDNPQYLNIGPEGTRRILEQLYPPTGQQSVLPFYQEVLDLIIKEAFDNGTLCPMLLGDHQASRAKKDLMSNGVFRELLGDVIERWPGAPYQGRGNGQQLNEWRAVFGPSSERLRRAFSVVLRRYLGPNRGHIPQRGRISLSDVSGKGVLPNGQDRLAPAREWLGVQNTLWSQKGQIRARAPQKPKQAHIYLDVSGSMTDVIPYLLSLILPYAANGMASVFQFSTMVHRLSFGDLRSGLLTTTGGTNIQCVVEHLLEVPEKIQKVLIISDGYVGKPHEEAIRALKARDMRIHVVLPSESPFRDDLRAITDSFTVLPPLEAL